MTIESALRVVSRDEIIAALALPEASIVDQRVPKKLLLENAAVTAADKRAINDHVSEVRWVAALKPNTIGVPAYRDEVREYLEIAVVSVALRDDPTSARGARLAELVHRAIPYPVFLILNGPTQSGTAEPIVNGLATTPLVLSLAHIRRAQNEAPRVVIDGMPESLSFNIQLPQITHDASQRTSSDPYVPFLADFCRHLAISSLPRTHMLALYQGWMNAFIALQTARVTGRFATEHGGDASETRRAALRALRDIDAQIATITGIATKERQLPRRVELNLQIQALRVNRQAAIAELAVLT